jgi:hypothetical protein
MKNKERLALKWAQQKILIGDSIEYDNPHKNILSIT